MKKIIAFATALLFSFGMLIGHAQTDQKQSKKKTETKKETPSDSTKKLKKDGTPDMRYKENKEAAKPVGPLKKDGTPDKRYKENKEPKKQ